MKDPAVRGGLASRRGVIFHPTLGYAIPPPLPPTVARRNARERSRVKNVNQSYEHLRLHVPSASQAKKMSKVEILKHSIRYIHKLRAMVEANSECEDHHHQGLVPPQGSSLPPCPSSPCTPGSTSGESGYSSPQPQAFLFPSSISTSSNSSSSNSSNSTSTTFQATSERSSNMLLGMQEEEDMILDVILDWQKS